MKETNVGALLILHIKPEVIEALKVRFISTARHCPYDLMIPQHLLTLQPVHDFAGNVSQVLADIAWQDFFTEPFGIVCKQKSPTTTL